MPNMTDYLHWRGDLSFSERPFNSVDNLVLATLSYVDFTDLVPTEDDGGSVTLSDAIGALLAKADGNVEPYIRSLAQVNEPFLGALADSARFGQAGMRAYVDIRDPHREVQFAALTVDLPSAPTYVSFRGTDSTLVGWKENFMLSFKVSGSQVSAAHYLRSRLSEYNELQVGGHSKGGNLAAYAAMCASAGELDRICRVWSNDGPGMDESVLPEGGYARLGSRLVRVVPTFSFVGMFFNEDGLDYRVVKSDGDGAYQHDPLTWQVERDDFVWADELDPECMVVNDTLREWLASIPLEDRARFTNELFDALEASGAVALHDLAHVGRSGFQAIANGLAGQDREMRDIWKRLATIGAERWAAERRDQAANALGTLKQSAEGLVRRTEE